MGLSFAQRGWIVVMLGGCSFITGYPSGPAREQSAEAQRPVADSAELERPPAKEGIPRVDLAPDSPRPDHRGLDKPWPDRAPRDDRQGVCVYHVAPCAGYKDGQLDYGKCTAMCGGSGSFVQIVCTWYPSASCTCQRISAPQGPPQPVWCMGGTTLTGMPLCRQAAHFCGY